MPVQSPVPKRLRTIIPANGYESPTEWQSTPTDGIELKHALEQHRRRQGFFDNHEETRAESVNSPIPGELFSSRLEEKRLSKSHEEMQKRKVSIKGRIKCFTWTWFTMVYATE
jgi:hypothetical protein